MPRQPRLDIPGLPQHVIQRGNNRQPCFLRDQDYRCYLQLLREACEQQQCLIHAYVLMTNHVHLLVTPSATGSLSLCMQSLGRRYVTYFNSTYHRTGTLWEGRYKASLVDSQTYLLTCYRYIELNPVRAAMVVAPEDYLWTSFRANALGAHDPLIHPHEEYLRLGTDPEQRQAAYQALFREAISDDQLNDIREHLQQQRALGTNRFQAAIEAELGRVARVRPPGRPRKVF
ncbi:transposase [Dyella caseinilytica]|uniref:Transposase n=2 Tax=Dyella caseinilytica TaxID=1849581 RepID=A0ABX7GPQ4_9GAMM|nr:transposase [Dyella caseinilytica]QRN52048.1 transposase [Dyella caseinilytica]